MYVVFFFFFSIDVYINFLLTKFIVIWLESVFYRFSFGKVFNFDISIFCRGIVICFVRY